MKNCVSIEYAFCNLLTFEQGPL